MQNRNQAPSYQTAPLTDYRMEFRALAEKLFAQASALVPQFAPKRYKGSYSFIQRNGRTAAKVLVFEERLGRKNGAFPPLSDGVYVLLRTDCAGLDDLGVAPKHEERFTYVKVEPTLLSQYAEQIVTAVSLSNQKS